MTHLSPPPATGAAEALPGRLLALLRCMECNGPLRIAGLSDRPGYPELGPDGYLACCHCDARYPLIAGTVRMLPRDVRSQLWIDYPLARSVLDDARIPRPVANATHTNDPTRRTAESFAYEWKHFGALRNEWRKNFADYMRPHELDSFAGRRVLDVGTGSGRHAFHAAALGAEVVAVDVGRSIDVARRNLPPAVMTVQADAEQLPFQAESFDFVMSIGVLHHLPDPQRALRRIAPLTRRGGRVHIYVYWVPPHAWHVRVLRLVTAGRRITVRLPHRLLHALCVPLAALLWLGAVGPYRLLRRVRRLRRLTEALPLKTYADYPFVVLVNDQFDRFSAPIERRYRHGEVLDLLSAAGLTDVCVLANHGWVGDGQVGFAGDAHAEIRQVGIG